MKKKFQRVLASDARNAIIIARARNPKASKKDLVVRAHSCGNCETVATINNVTDAGCPTCKTTMKPLKAIEAITVSAKDMAGLVVMAECDVCDSTLLTTPEVLSAAVEAGAKCHCIICTNELEIKASDDMEDDSELSSEEVGEKHSNVITDSEDEEDESDDEELVEADDSEDEEASFDDEDMTEEDESTDDEDSEADDSETDFESDEDDVGAEDETSEDEMPDDESEEEKIEASDNEAKTEPAAVDDKGEKTEVKTEVKQDGPVIQATALAHALSTDPEIELIASTLESGEVRYYLMANAAPIAYADKSRAKTNIASFFNDEAAYRSAFETVLSSEEGTVDEKLSDFGFEATKVDVPVDVATQQHIDTEVAKKTEAFNLSVAEIVKRFDECIATAATGLRKGTFGVPSPLRTALIKAFTENGVRGAASIVDNIIETASMDETKLILSKASELVVKSDDALKEITKVVESSLFVKTGAEDDTVEVKPNPARVSVASDLTGFNKKPVSNEITAEDVVGATVRRRNQLRVVG